MSTPLKIIITGIQGAGKTTTAIQLGKELGLPVYFVDQICFSTKWKKRPDDEINTDFEELEQGNKWVLDGFLFRYMDKIAYSTDVFIHINSSRTQSYLNIIKRRFQCFREDRKGVPENSNNKIYYSLLVKVWKRNRRSERRRIQKSIDEIPTAEHIVLKKISKKITTDIIERLKAM